MKVHASVLCSTMEEIVAFAKSGLDNPEPSALPRNDFAGFTLSEVDFT